MAKNSQRLPLDISIYWCYLHQDAGKNYSKISKMRSYRKHSKATIYKHMKKNIGVSVVELRKNNQFDKALARRDGKLLCKKSNDKNRHFIIY